MQIEIYKRISYNSDEIVKTNGFIEEVHKLVKEHEKKFKEDESEPDYSKDERTLLKGGKIIYGIPHDEVGKMVRMSKMEIQLKLKSNNEKMQEFMDSFNGILESINTLGDQIKTFTKKLAHNKADTMLIADKNSVEIKEMHDQLKEIETRVNEKLETYKEAVYKSPEESDVLLDPMTASY